MDVHVTSFTPRNWCICQWMNWTEGVDHITTNELTRISLNAILENDPLWFILKVRIPEWNNWFVTILHIVSLEAKGSNCGYKSVVVNPFCLSTADIWNALFNSTVRIYCYIDLILTINLALAIVARPQDFNYKWDMVLLNKIPESSIQSLCVVDRISKGHENNRSRILREW